MLLQTQKLGNSIESKYQASVLAMTKQVAHDIRSPVTALNALVASLPELPEEKRQFIIDISERISSIANDLLEKSKHIDVTFQDEPVDSIALNEINPEDVIRRVVEEKKLEFQNRKEVHFIHLASFRNVLCQVNEMELARVLSNLINNSIEAIENRGQIQIQSRCTSQKFEITIQDNGIGIPGEILEKLGREPVSFGKQRSQSGFGIGVYHAFKSIEAMGGRLSIESKLGSGTKVVISFPVLGKAA